MIRFIAKRKARNIIQQIVDMIDQWVKGRNPHEDRNEKRIMEKETEQYIVDEEVSPGLHSANFDLESAHE